MLSNVEHWLVSAAVVIALLVVLFACICGCRKKVPKNELLGLAGNVKITNPEENLDQNYHHENGSSTIQDNNRACVDSAEAHRRAGTSTANRSLPDIPVDPERVRLDGADTVWEASEPHSDAGSALYATVTDGKEGTAHLMAAVGELAGAEGPASDDGKGSEFGSLSQTEDAFAPYAQLKGEHPYDRLRKSEHPYAQVGVASSTSAPRQVSLRPRSSAPSAASDPVAPPRARKAASFHAERSSSDDVDIAAATAIAGNVAANHELPYMTPPIVAAAHEGQGHFSGDSQDSSKGYTSISVREPLANIKALSQQRQRRNVADDVYTTVSDDSEEVYADIEDAQGVYTDGSETYAQILPPPEPAPVAPPRDEAVGAPPPPSVDSLKHVAQAHSRQASSSSAASSVANLGSPKPEKRQANSPLPPPPPAGPAAPDLYATVDKKPALAPERTLDEMYAKVMKRNQRGKEAEDAAARRLSTDSRSHSTESEPGPDEAEPAAADGQSQSSVDSEDLRHPYRPLESAAVATGYADSGYEHVQHAGNDASYEQVQGSSDPNYEEVHRSVDQSYEEVNRSVDPNYEEVQRSVNPNYQEVERSIDPNYEEVHRSVDPNYEEVHRSVDPNYEEVHRSVHPNYEEVHRSIDPNYEEVHRPIDPNYEEVHRSIDPNYEEVARSLTDPNYEELRPQATGSSNRDSGSEPGYASIGYPDSSYEKVRAASLALPAYEKVRAKSLVEPTFEKVRTKSSLGPTFEKVRAKSMVEPAFETARPKSLAEPMFDKVRTKSKVEPSYAKINKRPKSAVVEEPGYARVANDADDASSTGGSEADPNYESIAHLRPAFDGAAAEPPYERLDNSRDSVSDGSPSERQVQEPRASGSERKASGSERKTSSSERKTLTAKTDSRDDWDTGRHKLI